MFKNRYIYLNKKALNEDKCIEIINSINNFDLLESRFYSGLPNATLNLFDEYIFEILRENLIKYSERNKILKSIGWKIWEQFNYQKYEPNQSYFVEHFEHGSDEYSTKRIIAWMFYLNTINNGGGTYWPQQKFKSNANCGDLIIWPASWTHSHYGIPAKNQEKYIITGWCNML